MASVFFLKSCRRLCLMPRSTSNPSAAPTRNPTVTQVLATHTCTHAADLLVFSVGPRLHSPPCRNSPPPLELISQQALFLLPLLVPWYCCCLLLLFSLFGVQPPTPADDILVPGCAEGVTVNSPLLTSLQVDVCSARLALTHTLSTH